MIRTGTPQDQAQQSRDDGYATSEDVRRRLDLQDRFLPVIGKARRRAMTVECGSVLAQADERTRGKLMAMATKGQR